MLKIRPRGQAGRRGHSDGQALVEFSLVFLIFITLFTGVLEFGAAFAVKRRTGSRVSPN